MTIRRRTAALAVLGLSMLTLWALPTFRPVASGTSRESAQAETPIEHIVIIHKENRSFDHMFGLFPGANGATQGEMSDGSIIDLVPALDPMPNDIGHSNSAFKLAYNNGEMNGFDLESGAFTEDGYPVAYSQKDESMIPNYWAYARRFGLADNAFSDFAGATFGNAVYRVAAQSGREDAGTGNRAIFGLPSGPNRPVFDRMGCDEPTDHRVRMRKASGASSDAFPCYSFQALPNILSDFGVSWRFYGAEETESFAFNALDSIASVRYNQNLWSNVVPLDGFEADALAGNLPAVSWVQPINTEHPNMGVACLGENETVRHINAIMNGPDWPTTAIIITWDEWGGFYDHVPPPQVDDISFGFRMPILVISPFVKYGGGSDGGYISSTFYSHASVLKLVEANWDLPAMTERDANSNDMMDFFDFEQTPKGALILEEHSCPSLTPEARQMMDSRRYEDLD